MDISNDANPLERTGAIMFVQAPTSNPQKDREWNDLDITASGQNYRVLVNGILVNEFFGSRSTVGHIGFQLGRGEVQLRHIRIKDLAPPPTLPAGPTTWTDTKGRSITATFKAVASGNVLLDIAGKVTPVPLNTLSAESQKLAWDYQRQAPPATASTIAATFTNTLGMKFLPVQGTDVLFCIHEVRYSDYAAYATEAQGVDGSWKDQSADGYALTENKENHPVMKVSWEDAQKFCAWLSKKEGKTYRLPTDQEWSYAVGIGRDEKWKKDTTPATVAKSQTDFPWGDKWPPPKGSGNYSDDSRKAKAPNANAQYLENYDDGFPTTAPVMSFKPNKLGLYDLEGNVREWVEDRYDNAKADRLLRGGCWYNFDRAYLLSSNRFNLPPGRRHNHGFRVVVVVSGG